MLEQTLVPDVRDVPDVSDVPGSAARPHVQTATVMSVATELPEGRLTSRELAASLGVSEDWIVSRTGVYERRRARPDERLTDYAIRAGARAHHVLLIGADLITRIVDYTDRRTAPLFADAAGAVVLGHGGGERGAIGPVVLGADGSAASLLYANHDERKIRMDGTEVFRHAVARMGDVTYAAVAEAGLTLRDIDLFVYHQANARITRALGDRLGLDPDRVVDCIATLGNASAATLPLALSVAQQDGRLRSGARVLVSAFGAGFTWGGGVIEWGASV